MSVRLYIGNLPKEVEKQEFEDVFAEYGEAASMKLITDRKTGKCRGFGFVTVKDDELADQIIEKFNGYEFKETTLKIEKALPRAKAKADEAEGSAPSRRAPKGAKPRRAGDTPETATTAAQPDPRWASELEKLKSLLAAQTANS
ncbi:RNA-binding protein [Leptolyngbya sp. CCY15150]|uniref:RNA recognition motif domain-containing protein n=1 Tax=Leptolyngbya sp. CCY15150 TaxID=2767772 RepID=UPI00195228E2|nr:RNA-binding protein [Leptolyngbya sp. CCY15150]